MKRDSIAEVQLTEAVARRLSGHSFLAQAKLPSDGARIPYGQWSVLVEPVGEGEVYGAAPVVAFVTFVALDAPAGALSPGEEVTLFNGTEEIGRALIMTTVPEPKVAAVSYVERDDGRMLCVWNERYDGWGMPGGLVEEGESIEAAQKRELKEEAGVATVSAQLVWRGPHGLPHKPGRATEVAVFRVKIDGEPRPAEGREVRWCTRQEFLATSPFAPLYRKLFATVLCRVDHA